MTAADLTCDTCRSRLGLVWVSHLTTDPLLGESRRELCFWCYDRERAPKWTPSVGVWRKPKKRKAR